MKLNFESGCLGPTINALKSENCDSKLMHCFQLRWPTLVRSIPGQKKIKGGTLCV
jgi:hypothetical protein